MGNLEKLVLGAHPKIPTYKIGILTSIIIGLIRKINEIM